MGKNLFSGVNWRLPYGTEGREEVTIMSHVREMDAINSVRSRYAKYLYQY